MDEETTDNMPSISKNIIRFGAEDALSSLSPQYQASINAVSSFGDDQISTAIDFDPFRALGVFSPGCAPTDFTTVSVMNALGLGMAIGSEGGTRYGYVICDSARINRFQLSNQTFTNAGSWPKTVAGVGAITNNDIVPYTCNIAGTPTKLIFYSYNDGGATWNVGEFNTAAGTFDDDWMSMIPATPLVPAGSSKPHPMIVGKDDLLYIGDGNKLHSLDGRTGTNGTFADTVLLLPADYIITTFAKFGDFLAIFAYKNPANSVSVDTISGSEATCFIWNYLDLDVESLIPLGTSTVSAAFEYGGTIGCIATTPEPVREVNSADRTGSLMIYDGSRFVTVAKFQGNPPVKNGVYVVDEAILWSSDGKIFCYGSLLPGVKAGLNQITSGSGSTSGMFYFLPGILGFMILSSGTTTSGGMQYFSSGFSGDTVIVTPVAVPQLGPGNIARLKNITIYYAKTSSAGNTLRIGIVTDSGTTSEFAASVGAITSSNIVSKYEYLSNGDQPPRFTEIKVFLTYTAGISQENAPLVKYIDVEYEVVNNQPTP